MKQVFNSFQSALKAVVFLLVLSSSAKAQDAVLICAWEFESDAANMKALVEKYYDGPVQTVTQLPSDLTPFRAVISIVGNGLATSDQTIMANYLEQGGKLLVVGNWTRMSEPGDLREPLWNRVRDTSMVMAATSSPSPGVFGVNGKFTEGFVMNNPNYNGFDLNLGGMYRAQGLIPILYEASSIGLNSEAAHVSADTSLRFVFFCPQGSYFADRFIGLTLCEYFNLCALSVESKRSEAASIDYDPFTRELSFPSEGTVEIHDILGRQVFSKSESSTQFILPSSLVAGTYIVHWQSKGEQVTKKIVIH